MNIRTLQETIDLWTREPQRAQGQPTVTAREEGSQAVLQSGSFTWRADLPPALGGTNQAPSPTALLLSALAGCAVTFIRDTLAPQLGIRVESVEATARCRTDSRGLLGLDPAMPDLQDVELTIAILSPEPEERVQTLYRTWQERCPIYLALTKPVPVRTALERRGS